MSEIEELKSEIVTLKTRLFRIERAFRRFKKSLIPESERKVRKPSGFAKPSLLSDELCEFLQIDKKSCLPRTEVTKLILKYVKDNNLQNPEEKKFILLDEKLTDLLKPNVGEKISYFNIQKLLKNHYFPVPVTSEEPSQTMDVKEEVKETLKPKKKKNKTV